MKGSLKVKKTFAFFMAVLCAVSVFTSCKQSEISTPTGMKEISNEAAGYEMFVPDDWVQTESTGVCTATAGAETNTTVSAAKIQNKTNVSTVEEYFALYKEDFLAVMPDFMEQSDPVNEIVKKLNGDADIDIAAKRFTYTGTLSDKLRKYSMVIAMDGTDIYILTFTSTKEEYDIYYSQFQNMVLNFRIS